MIVVPYWSISLTLGAALAITSRGGFSAFRRLMWYEVITQYLEMVCAGNGDVYKWVHRSVEIAAIPLLCFTVVDGFRRMETDRPALWIAVAAGATIPALPILYEPVMWSQTASFVWAAVAISHVLLAAILALFMYGAEEWDWFDGIFALWMFGTGALFFIATSRPIGAWLVWWNIACWAVMLVSRHCTGPHEHEA